MYCHCCSKKSAKRENNELNTYIDRKGKDENHVSYYWYQGFSMFTHIYSSFTRVLVTCLSRDRVISCASALLGGVPPCDFGYRCKIPATCILHKICFPNRIQHPLWHRPPERFVLLQNKRREVCIASWLLLLFDKERFILVELFFYLSSSFFPPYLSLLLSNYVSIVVYKEHFLRIGSCYDSDLI